MSLQLVLADLKRIYAMELNLTVLPSAREWLFHVRGEHLTEEDVQRWSALTGASRAVLYDQIAVCLALGFHNSELTFTFCDAIVNDIHRIITFAGEDRPDLFWKVFLAFDNGEYRHRDNPDGDPVAAYTRPLIAQTLADHLPATKPDCSLAMFGPKRMMRGWPLHRSKRSWVSSRNICCRTTRDTLFSFIADGVFIFTTATGIAISISSAALA